VTSDFQHCYAEPASTVTTQRLYYLDNIKIALIITVIFVHAAQPYGPGGAWFITAPVPIPLINILIVGAFLAIAPSFFMGLFFFISAYFIPGSFDRKGERRFLRDRFIRLGVPLIIMLTTIIPLVVYLLKGLNQVAFLYPPYLSFYYLWFVVILLITALVYAAWRRSGLTVPAVTCPGNGTLLAAACALGVANFVVRIWYPINQWTLFDAIEPAHVPLYALLIVGGLLAYRNKWLDALPNSLTRLWGAIVAVCFFGLFGLFIAFGTGLAAGGATLASLLESFWEAFIGIGICTCALIVFRNRWNGAGRVTRVLAQNVYAVYLIQWPVVLGLQWVLINTALPLLLQFLLVGVIATALCFLISNYVVRRIPYAEQIVF